MKSEEGRVEKLLSDLLSKLLEEVAQFLKDAQTPVEVLLPLSEPFTHGAWSLPT